MDELHLPLGHERLLPLRREQLAEELTKGLRRRLGHHEPLLGAVREPLRLAVASQPQFVGPCRSMRVRMLSLRATVESGSMNQPRPLCSALEALRARGGYSVAFGGPPRCSRCPSHHPFRRYSASARWTSWMHTEPSPTAEATRLTLLARTSPTAKTRGRLVSNRYGGRASGQRARRGPSARQVRPGAARSPWRRARRSRGATPCSGSAPAIEKTWRIGVRRSLARRVVAPGHRARGARRPRARRCCVRRWSVMFGVSSMRRTR